MESSLDSRRRLRSETEMDITPMIDMTFLLLIFFLVASKMDQGTELSLPEARHGTAVTEKTSAVVCLTGGDSEQAMVYLGEKLVEANRVPAGDASQIQEAVVNYVREELAAGKLQVIIRADKLVRHRDVDRIMKAIGAMDEVPMFVAVLEQR